MGKLEGLSMINTVFNFFVSTVASHFRNSYSFILNEKSFSFNPFALVKVFLFLKAKLMLFLSKSWIIHAYVVLNGCCLTISIKGFSHKRYPLLIVKK